MAFGRIGEHTSWIDEDLNYIASDKSVIREKSNKEGFKGFINVIFTKKGILSGDTRNRYIREDFVKLTRSLIAVAYGDGKRPLLNNSIGHEILKNIRYSRTGKIGKIGLKTILTYKSVEVLEYNTTKGTYIRRNQDKNETKEFNNLVSRLIEKNEDLVNTISDDNNIPHNDVDNIIGEYDSQHYTPMSDQQIRDMVIEKHKSYNKEPGSSIGKLRGEQSRLSFEDFDQEQYDNLPDVPETVIDHVTY